MQYTKLVCHLICVDRRTENSAQEMEHKEDEMLGDYGREGWDQIPDDEENGEGNGGGGRFTPEERLFRFRFRMPDAGNNPIQKGKPVTHRLLFLNGVPFSHYEHNLWSYKGCGHYTAMCLSKNDIDDRGCPLCDKKFGDDWPYLIGHFGVVDMGQVEYLPKGDVKLHHRTWTNTNGEEIEDSFPKVLLSAKKGSKKKPGVLQTLRWKAERYGGTLEGTVWDVSRSGDKEANIGEDWAYVERIAPSDYERYLVSFGADPERLDVEPISNWKEICKPIPYEEICRIVGKPLGGGGSRGGTTTDGAGYDDGDDIPF